MKRRTFFGIAIILGVVTALGQVAVSQDWPQWRGPARDGAAPFNVPASWPEMLQQKWRVDVGLGYATPLVVGNRLYVFTRQGGDEVMQALDAATGKSIWRTSYPAPFEMVKAAARHREGPKSTPAYAAGRLFTLGMSGIFTAFDAQTGRQLWQKPGSASQPLYHTGQSPVVDGNTVIVHLGGPMDAALSAFDVATGNVRWRWDGDSPAYGSPMVVDLGGTRQVVAFTFQNLVGISMATGQLLWRRPFITPSNTTSQTPIFYRDMVIQAGRDNGITAFRAIQRGGTWTTGNVWQTKDVSLHLTNGVVADGILYGLSHLNSGQYFALDLDNGQVLWTSEPRQAENAAMARAGNTIFSLQADAKLVILNASRMRFDPVRTYEMAMSETWAQPALSGNRMFVKDVTNLTLWTLN